MTEEEIVYKLERSVKGCVPPRVWEEQGVNDITRECPDPLHPLFDDHLTTFLNDFRFCLPFI